jgi:hypothetical protein
MKNKFNALPKTVNDKLITANRRFVKTIIVYGATAVAITVVGNILINKLNENLDNN